MVRHICNKEKEIAEIYSMVKSIHSDLKGNGQPGLLSRFNRMEGGVNAFKWLFGTGIVTALILAAIGLK